MLSIVKGLVIVIVGFGVVGASAYAFYQLNAVGPLCGLGAAIGVGIVISGTQVIGSEADDDDDYDDAAAQS